jgi:hypothetical protein
MSRTSCGDTGGDAIRRNAILFRITDGLALAASPTFAIMALISSAPAETLCSAAHASPLSGMATMYVLMSAFHAAPWLKLIRDR